MNRKNVLVLVLACLIVAGCASRHYERTRPGLLQGDLVIEWRKPNSFIFIPSGTDPLKFTGSSNGDVIQPDRTWTDGGSMPS